MAASLSDRAKAAAPDRPLLPRGPPSREADFPIVGIGASAGGLDACRKFLAALPADSGMAFILVQHLDPDHESMMVDLLASHTTMTVSQVNNGQTIERDHLYIIPPGAYLSVVDDILHLSQPRARHGARLPFDFLLQSMATAFGPRAVCVILSGTGADGSLGLKAVKEKGGFVIAQDPDEAGYGGMPRNAILTGSVDAVSAVAGIPDILAKHARDAGAERNGSQDAAGSRLIEIIELLRSKTPYDFTLYKPGTLQRRIERRMIMAAIDVSDMDRYLQMLHTNEDELVLLAKDLLINVTSFFRDPSVFDLLAEATIPELVRNHAPDKPIRIWIAGCSTGEETYSLAMLFQEAIAAAKLSIKLQVFASDVDPDAIATARDGLYPDKIEAEISPSRLARFFSKEEKHYRVSQELRAAVVFTVQDVLADPPFSRLDFISCRNLLIYLRPEAQAKVLALFHFALREGGILLLGTSETAGADDDRFEVVSKAQRIFRHVGRSRPGELGFIRGGDGVRAPVRPGQAVAPSRQAVLAELCRCMVMETYAPAAVLINRKHECLYSLGATDRYLRVVPGQPSNDLLAMARQGIRTKLRSAIQQASQENARISIPGGRTGDDIRSGAFSIDVQPVRSDGEELLLVCFVDDPKAEAVAAKPGVSHDVPRVAELERELEATRTELQGAIHNLEISGEEQKAVNEEALSVQEEYQSTNEELLTSKEELQSLNEELTALNSQLQETLERQRTTSDDLQNVLYSTDVATLFLDRNLNIRFFTPATRALFAILPGDVGRPLSDLNSLAADGNLVADATAVLRTLVPIEREIATRDGSCFIRRVLPYRAQNDAVEGVVITFADITERRRIADELGIAKQQADQANTAKSRFLAAASHDLRQPLQTLALVQGLLAKHVDSEKGKTLVVRLEETLGAMSGMLNTLLDINEIDAGIVHAEIIDFPIESLLDRLRDEFAYHARARGLSLRVVPCSLTISSDPRLLEQMIRNLLSNALKYTRRGKILLGCRRHTETLSIEVWDTGIGIPDHQLQAIFDEYRQLDNPARERSRGLGLGLSIVQRLGALLGHQVRVRSVAGRGSVFSIEIKLPATATAPAPEEAAPGGVKGDHHTGSILVIEDDPDIRGLLEDFLQDEGHDIVTAYDGVKARELIGGGMVKPDLVLADFNLPNGLNGAVVAGMIREALGYPVPAIILTGDISAATASTVALQHCIQLNKPVKLNELALTIQRLLPLSLAVAHAPRHAEDAAGGPPVIYVVDDDDSIRGAIRAVLEDDDRDVEDYETCEAFLAAFHPGRAACLVIDAYLRGMNGLTLLRRLREAGHALPAIMITGNSDVAIAVEAMKAGASDFIEKPISRDELLASVDLALERSRDSGKLSAWRNDAASHVARLTPRQRQIMDMVLAGQPSKNIAADLGISQRTVENHRASIMAKTDTKSLPALARMALAAVDADAGGIGH
nr:chemotaxis protein CheB [uncultured Rhodopila sp.]